MKLILVLDPASAGLRASHIKDGREISGTEIMEPMVRLFDSEK
jgi:hypothetical protein